MRIPYDDMGWLIDNGPNKFICFPRNYSEPPQSKWYPEWVEKGDIIWVNDFERTNDSSRKIRQQA